MGRGAPRALAAPDDVTAVTRLVTTAHGLRTLLVTGTRHPHSPPAARHPVVTALDDRLDVTTLTTRDLMLTADVLRAAAASWGHPVDDRMLACVVELVGGWPALGGTPQRWVMPAVLRDELRAHLAEHDRAFVVEAHRTLAQDWTLLELVSLEFGTYLAVIGGATVDDCYARVPAQVAATSW
ncbi:hypothetical protein ACT17Q_15955 [Cellulomonas sp. CW35]|uniref:hypothetical protein n=1 Tax=Cellulomonas sp. CW35 TaxID=3458249 RepID=UPI0040345BD8